MQCYGLSSSFNNVTLQLLCVGGLARSHFNCNAMNGLRSICLLKLFLFPTVFTLQLQCDERAKLNTSASLSQRHHRSARCILALIKREVIAGRACFMPILARLRCSHFNCHAMSGLYCNCVHSGWHLHFPRAFL